MFLFYLNFKPAITRINGGKSRFEVENQQENVIEIQHERKYQPKNNIKYKKDLVHNNIEPDHVHYIP